MRIARKSNERTNKKGQEVASLVSAHKSAISGSPNIFKLASKNSSPCIRQSNGAKNKMKKLQLKKLGKTEDFSWFESDKNFGFTE